MRRFSAFSLVGLFAFAATSASAQTPPVTPPPQAVPVLQTVPTGRITGRVIDASTGRGIDGVAIQVVGKEIIVKSGLDGRYNINRVPTGPLALHLQLMGFAPKQVDSLYLHEDEALEQDITLGAVQIKLNTVVTAAAERGSVNAALDQQRTSTAVTSTTTAEQIARSPDGNAAQAIQRVSGVTTQDNKFVFVRGLGERYTTTSLNGTRVPSAEPEKRVVPLDMFPAGLLQSITTFKTFTPDQQGDFAGAVVDIQTKEFPARRTMAVQLGSGYASGATGNSLLSATSVGGEGLGLVNHSRDLPSSIRSLGNFQNVDLSQGDINRLVNSFRDSWTPRATTAAPLMNGSVSIGGNDPLLFGHRIGYLAAATLSSGTDIKEHQVRALAIPGGVQGTTVEADRFEGQSVSQGILWGGLTSVSTLIGTGSRISFNGLYNRSADNDARVETGVFTSDALRVKLTRMQYVQRSLHSAQLAGEHEVGAGQRVNWKATLSGVRRFEPDRSEFAQVIDRDAASGADVLRWLTGGSGGAVRTFSDLNEHSQEFVANYQLTLGAGAAPPVIKVGGLYRHTARDAESFSYALSARNASNEMRELAPEEIFDGRFTTDTSDIFTLGPLSQGGSYTARDVLGAGFIMADVPLGSSIRLIGGGRFESDHLDVSATSTLGSPVNPKKVWNDFLPSLALNIQLSETQQLRVSASRTLARPEYRELTPIISRDVINGENVQGDESLTRTNVSNADVRWEAYPQAGELFGIAVFAKHFTRPIERVYGSGSGGTSFVFYTNAESADNYGVEFEVRRNLAVLSDALAPVTVFGNATLMESQIHLFKDTQAAATNLSRRMVGQAPYVLNTGITYASDGGALIGTLLYNRVGPRINAAGSIPLPDVVEQSRDVVDFSLRVNLTQSVGVRFDAKNLLDSPYTVLQGSVTRENYRAGRAIQAGLSWRP